MKPHESGNESAAALALRALRCCRAGKLGEAAALYRRAFAAPGGGALPVIQHVRLLEGTGLSEAASTIWRIGLQGGADLSSGLLAGGADPCAAVAEYEDLFARGVTNARMMANYLVALSRVGASEKLATAVAPHVLFRQVSLPVDGTFLASVTAGLLAAGREFQTARKSIRNLERIVGTHKLDDPAVVALHAMVHREIAHYIDDVARSGHLIAPWLRRDFRLASWGVMAEHTGYSAPHIHTGCWVVAVAYIAGQDPGPDGNNAGSLRVGPAVEGNAHCAGWPDLTIAPVPGRLVIMPAFYTHWTVPLTRPGLRLSVAFNADDLGTA
jgi:hypothetical protein